MALRYVKKQTKEICIEVIRQNGMALVYIEIQDEEMCLEAVKRSPKSICFILKAVMQNKNDGWS